MKEDLSSFMFKKIILVLLKIRLGDVLK